ncbi:MAG: T9SS type A sorting domain-containing protein [Chitinophagaceae bacterium]|nr:T9SS type A sorting domain-containing protein [Chitinophagaceae bacterium]
MLRYCSNFLVACFAIFCIPAFIFAQPTFRWNTLIGGSYSSIGNTEEGKTAVQTADGGFVIGGVTNSADGDLQSLSLIGGNDVWIVKTDAAGTIQWQKILGGTANDICNSVIITQDGGYLVTGATYSSDGNITVNKGRSDLWIVKLSSTGTVQWQKTYGGSFEDEGMAAVLSGDGGYIITGYTFSNNNDVTLNKGISDVWILKLDANGLLVWQKTFGGNNLDQANSIAAAADGFILGGYTYSNGGDVTGKKGGQDAWLLKINSSGTLLWQKTLGGNLNEYASSITVAGDGSIFMAGGTTSNDGDVSGNKGGLDIWVVKLSSTAALTWQKCLGGTLSESANAITLHTDGSIFTVGYTNSSNGDVSGNAGQTEVWAVKLSSTNTILWQNCLGGTGNEVGNAAVFTNDNSLAILGRTNSSNGDVSGLKGGTDFWLIKLSNTNSLLFQKTFGGASVKAKNIFNKIISATGRGSIAVGSTNSFAFTDFHGNDDFFVTKFDSTGGVKWQKCFGGNETDIATSVIVTKDSGYLVVGYTISDDGDITSSIGSYDGWILKLDSTGAYEWDVSIGGTDDDYLSSVTSTYDGHFAVAGYTSSADGDAIGNRGLSDFWIVKVSNTGSVIWKKCYGGTDAEEAYDIAEGKDSSLVITGHTFSEDGNISINNGASDIWVIRLSKEGNLLWQKSIGGSNVDMASAVTATADGSFVVAGNSSSNDFDFTVNKGGRDFCVFRINTSGTLQWQKTFGGSNDDEATDILANSENEFVLIGQTKSNNGDVSGFKGVQDLWLLNLKTDGSLKWQSTLGGTQPESGISIASTAKGNYLIAGYSVSNNGDLLNLNTALNANEKAWAFEINNCPYPSITASGPLEFCAGSGQLTLSVENSTGYTYQWLRDNVIINGANASNYSISSSGAYAVRVTNTIGCQSISTPVNAVVKLSPVVPNIISDGPTTKCIGDGLIINTTPVSNVFYDWRRNGSGIIGLSDQNFYFATTAGSYTLILQDKSNNCRSAESNSVTVNFVPKPLQPIITVNANSFLSSSTTGNQWYLNDNLISGATGQQYIPTASGIYTVIVTINGCSSEVSDPVNFVITSTSNFTDEYGFKFYPVPVQRGNNLTITGNPQTLNYQTLTLVLTDINGLIITQRTFAQHPLSMPMNYAAGVYTIRIYSREKKLLAVSKIIIK